LYRVVDGKSNGQPSAFSHQGNLSLHLFLLMADTSLGVRLLALEPL